MKSKLIRCFGIAVGVEILIIAGWILCVCLAFSSGNASLRGWRELFMGLMREDDLWPDIGRAQLVIIPVFWIIALLGAHFSSRKAGSGNSKGIMRSTLMRCLVVAVVMTMLAVVFLAGESSMRLMDAAVFYILPFWIIALLGARFGSAKTENKESK